jgi:hypothetical protein
LGRWTQAAFAVSERRVVRLLPIQLATLRYRSRRDPQLGLTAPAGIAANRVRFGSRRLTVLLRREVGRSTPSGFIGCIPRTACGADQSAQEDRDERGSAVRLSANENGVWILSRPAY